MRLFNPARGGQVFHSFALTQTEPGEIVQLDQGGQVGHFFALAQTEYGKAVQPGQRSQVGELTWEPVIGPIQRQSLLALMWCEPTEREDLEVAQVTDRLGKSFEGQSPRSSSVSWVLLFSSMRSHAMRSASSAVIFSLLITILVRRGRSCFREAGPLGGWATRYLTPHSGPSGWPLLCSFQDLLFYLNGPSVRARDFLEIALAFARSWSATPRRPLVSALYFTLGPVTLSAARQQPPLVGSPRSLRILLPLWSGSRHSTPFGPSCGR